MRSRDDYLVLQRLIQGHLQSFIKDHRIRPCQSTASHCCSALLAENQLQVFDGIATTEFFHCVIPASRCLTLALYRFLVITMLCNVKSIRITLLSPWRDADVLSLWFNNNRQFQINEVSRRDSKRLTLIESWTSGDSLCHTLVIAKLKAQLRCRWTLC